MSCCDGGGGGICFVFCFVNVASQHYNVQNKQLINVVLYYINRWAFKGIVHPKMKTLSLITHPHVVQVLHSCSEHKLRYF